MNSPKLKKQEVFRYNLSKMKECITLKDKKSYNCPIRHKRDDLFQVLFNKGREGAAFIIVNKDGELNNFSDVNESIINTLHYSKSEILNMSIYDIVDNSEREKIRQMVKRLFEEKQLILETVVISKYGEKRDLEVGGNVIELKGKKVVLLISRDITERKKTERALLESEERCRKLIELLPDAVHIKQEGRIVYSNETGAKLLGAKDAKEFLGRQDSEFTHPDYRQLSVNRGRKVLSLGEKVPLAESKIIRIDGQTVDVEVASTAIDYNGKPSILSVIRDISERKKSEEQMKRIMNENKELLNQAIESEKSKTEFFTNISHEFKTPLNVILGIIQLLNIQSNSSNGLNMDCYNKYIQMMRQNCFRLLRLINNLLDITKIDSGYFQLNLKNYNIVNIVEEVTLSVAEYANNKAITIIFDTEVEEKIICCDEEKIERIILNLLSNAIKYNKEIGKIFVNIYEEKENILISVKDTGIGIPEEKLKEVFDRFKQVDTSLHRTSEGSGIGLALVKSLVEKHGGEISVSSIYGEGTEFIVKLPVKVLPIEEIIPRYDYLANSLVEKINIEFSDIYKLY